MPIASRCKRSLPFLQRNWTRGLNSSQAMGAASSSPSGAVGERLRESLDANYDSRPQKRRKVGASNNSTTSIATDVLEPVTAVPNGVVKKDPSLVDQLFVAHEVGSVQRTLRVEVLKIVHKDLARVKVGNSFADSDAAPRNVRETKARCKVMLTYAAELGEDVMLHCQSQFCSIKSFQSPAGPFPMARINLSRPFHIPEDSILIHRADNHQFDLADSYKITVELEPVGTGDWPPLGNATFTGSDPMTAQSKSWVLTGEVVDIFSKGRSMAPLQLRVSRGETLMTEYLFDVDARWTTGFEASAIRPLEKGVEPSITVEGSPSPGKKRIMPIDFITSPSMDQRKGFLNGDAREDDEDEHDGELTPNRSLRTRETKNYNLKLLSDKAQGRERARKKPRNAIAAESGHVSYDLPAELVHLNAYRCVTCGGSHTSLKQLQAHLEWQHPEYEFVAQTGARGTHFRVSHWHEETVLDPDTYELTMPAKSFGLNSAADGEDTGDFSLRLRLGLAENSDQVRNGKYKKKGSYNVSPAEPKEAPTSKGKKILVPKTTHPLYDPLSRLPLEPGSEFQRVKPDDRWLIQWHRDAIEDFSDILPAEREFMTTWDEFMITQRIASDAFLPSSWLEFVKLKADWLVSSPSRMTEFGKHITYLITRGALNDGTIKKAFQIIASAKARLAQRGHHDPIGASAKQSPKGPQARKSAANCQVCDQQALGPRLLFCSNPDCKRRIYHSDCIGENAKMNIQEPDWVCNMCYAIPSQQRT